MMTRGENVVAVGFEMWDAERTALVNEVLQI